MENTEKDIFNFIKSYFNPYMDRELSEDEFLKCRYLDQGFIDSFEIIHLISDLEVEFEIRLESYDTESDEFRYIEGLIQIIKSKL